MSNFDENENHEELQEGTTSEEIKALIENGTPLTKEEKRLEKERRKEEKRLEKERRKQEKLEKKMQKEGLDDLPEVSMADLKRAAKQAAEESKRAMEEVEGKTSGNVNASEASSEEAGEPASEATKASGMTSDESTDGKEQSEDSETEEPDAAEEKERGGRRRKKSKRKERPEDVNIVKDLLSLIIYIGIVILICFLIITYVGRRTTVHGDSMEPTLQSGDSLWINMLAYRFGEPKRYDIIVFPYQDDVNYIKRVIGLPGETVQITDNGDILINGEVLVEPKQFDRIRNNGIASSPITLGPDEVFVLGDNRNNSRDSRWADVGNIKLDKIVGRAAFRLTPFKKFGGID